MISLGGRYWNMETRISWGRSAQKLKLGRRGNGFSLISDRVDCIVLDAGRNSEGKEMLVPVLASGSVSRYRIRVLGSKYDMSPPGVPGVLVPGEVGAVENPLDSCEE